MEVPHPHRLLISHITLRGPELQQIYTKIAEHKQLDMQELRQIFVVPNDIEDPFKLEEAALREALSFLNIAHMIDKRKYKERTTYSDGALDHKLPFPLRFLSQLRQHPDKRQQAISLIFEQLIINDVLFLSQQQLRDEQERGPFRELFTWTNEKIAFWTHLASYLGMVYRIERESTILIAPHPTFLLSALRAVASWATPIPSAKSSLQHIDQHFFTCFTKFGRLHRGITQTLLTLEREGMIQLTHQSDATQSLLLDNRRVSEIAFPLGGTEW